MSVLTCDSCGDWIDTDDEPEAYDEATDRWFCWRCREEEENAGRSDSTRTQTDLG